MLSHLARNLNMILIRRNVFLCRAYCTVPIDVKKKLTESEKQNILSILNNCNEYKQLK